MILDRLITAASFSPHSLQFPNAWVGHIPFAAWVIQEVSPKIFVELGTHSGNSYFAFCQSVAEAALSTKCYSVDTWQGDEHAGEYTDEIFRKVNAHNQENYISFSRLLRMTFDTAVAHFEDKSIELLHIDGLHTYEEVKHDFETWLPKLAPGAVVIFHDISVRERNFGVWKLWEELQICYPNNIGFAHSHGLGVLQLNNAPEDNRLRWLHPNTPEKQQLVKYFAALGSRQLERFDLVELNELKQHAANLTEAVAGRDGHVINLNQVLAERDSQIISLNQILAERDSQIISLNQILAERDGQIINFNQVLAERDSQIINFNQVLAERDSQIISLNQILVEQVTSLESIEQRMSALERKIADLYQSTSWRITSPLRIFKIKARRAKYISAQLMTLSGWQLVLSKFRTLMYEVFYKHKLKREIAQLQKKSETEHELAEKTDPHAAEKVCSVAAPHKRIIVVSHNAYKEGAPILALHLIKHLRNFFDYEVVTLLAAGGDIASEFEAYSRVYRYDLLTGNERTNLCELLHEQGYNFALCNTSAVGYVVEDLTLAGIECTSLIHELPYVINIANLKTSLEKIFEHSKNFIFPAEYVKSRLEESFKIDHIKSHIRNQGRFMRNPYLRRSAFAREQLRLRLQCSTNTRIILGVGSGEYRKGIDLFVDAGINVLSRQDNILFVWVGNVKDDESESAKKKILLSNTVNYFRFLEFEKDIGLFYSGSDLFFLASREDPFPSVYIDALTAGIPVIAFNNAGGFVDTHSSIGGTLVDNFNTVEAADSIVKILNDDRLYSSLTDASSYLASQFGFNSYIYDLLNIAGTKLNRVSVIVPNYNYEEYIADRLNSIFHQTVKPFEIIFLDDSSTDNSLEIAAGLLEDSGFDYTILTNTENNGCYKQWLKGIKAVKGDVIWIAEADDLSDPRFIEKLLPELDNPEINITYCQSLAIDSKSNPIDFSYINFTGEFSTTRWLSNFTNAGASEITNYLVQMNTIPNASGVLIRKSALVGIDDMLSEYTTCGDWFVYVYALGSGSISFVSDSLNYHRRHINSIIHTQMYTPRLLQEILMVSKFIFANYEIEYSVKEKLVKRFCDYYMLISDHLPTLSMDPNFKKLFYENGLEQLWEIVEKK
jgi:glycosyltransferase involved in cell wall biosynthesis